MPLLEFDCSRSVDVERGIAACDFDARLSELDATRASLFEGGEGPPVASLARETLRGYEQHRDASELGRVFALANRLHDEVDACVFVAEGGTNDSVQAILGACQHPYHNELSRGARGSKPRLYVAGDGVDNDATQALIDRLVAPASGNVFEGVPRDRWALIPIVGEDSQAIAATTGVLLRELRRGLGDSSEEMLAGLVMPVGQSHGALAETLASARPAEPFSPPVLPPSFGVLTAAGLLPAAILGLDCIQFLEGAAVMAEHFQTASAAENVVLKFVASNRGTSKEVDAGKRVICVGTQSLLRLGYWYQHMFDDLLGHASGESTPAVYFTGKARECLCSGVVVNNLVVKQCRSDVVAWNAGSTLPDLMTEAAEQLRLATQQAGIALNEIRISEIDTHSLGQLFAMFIMASVLESRQLGINLSDRFGQI